MQRSGERPSLMAEELGGDQGRLDGGAVDTHHRAGGARRASVDRACDAFLAVPVSPRISTVESVGATNATRSIAALNAALSPTSPPDAIRAGLAAQVFPAGGRPIAWRIAARRASQSRGLVRTRAPGLHRAHRGRDVEVAGDEDDWHRTSASASCRCTSRPLRPGRLTSRTRQAGGSVRHLSRTSPGEAKVSTRRFTERISACTDSRTETSSSRRTPEEMQDSWDASRWRRPHITFKEQSHYTLVSPGGRRCSAAGIASSRTFSLNGFSREATAPACEQGTQPFVGDCGDEDDGNRLSPPRQLLLEGGSAHVRHGDVEDEAVGAVDEVRGEELLGRGERPRLQAERPQQLRNRLATDWSSSTTDTSADPVMGSPILGWTWSRSPKVGGSGHPNVKEKTWTPGIEELDLESPIQDRASAAGPADRAAAR